MNLRIAFVLVIPLTLAAASAARAADVGYVDMTKAISGTAEGKAAIADAEAIAKAKQLEYDAATKAADACKTRLANVRDKCTADAKQKAREIETAARQEAQDRLSRTAQPLEARANRILPKLAMAHRLTGGISPSSAMLYVPPKLDFTVELTKRLDAGEGKTDEDLAAELQQKNAELEKEVAKLKAEKIAAAKPVVSDPRPAAPQAVATKDAGR